MSAMDRVITPLPVNGYRQFSCDDQNLSRRRASAYRLAASCSIV